MQVNLSPRLAGLALGLILTVLGSTSFMTERALGERGIRTRIQTPQLPPPVQAAASASTDAPTAEVHYLTREGRPVIVKDVALPRDVVDRIRAHQDVFIDYLPEDTQRIRFEGHGQAGTSLSMAVAGLMLMALFLFWRRG